MMKVRNKKPVFLLFFLLMAFASHGQWVRSAKSRVFSRASAVASDPAHNVFTAGIFSCITAFDGDSLLNNSCGEVSPPAPAVSQVDGFLSKRDENGNVIWVNHFRGSTGNRLLINDIAVDNAGNCYVTGAYTGDLDLLAGQFSNPDATTEFFLAKILSDGTGAWAVSYPLDALSETSAQKLAVTPDAVYITGYARDDFRIGALIDSVGNNASFVASFDLNGNPAWTRHFREVNSNGSSMGKAIEASGDSVWVFSAFTDSVRIGGSAFKPPGTVTTATAGVICLYDASGTLLNQVLTNTPFIESMRVHRSDASIYLAGRAENITAIGGDTLFSNAGVRAYVTSHSLDLASLQWVVPLTAPATTALTATDLDVSAQGNIFVTGTFNGGSIAGPATSATGGGDQNGFIANINASGADVWLQSLGGAGEDALSSVSAPDDNVLFACGYFNQYIRVVGDEIHSTAASNGMVARIDVCPQLVADMLTSDSIYICDRNTALFQVTNNAANSYLWFKDGSALLAATSADLQAGEEGTYRAFISDGLGCTKFTPTARLFLNALPDSVVLTNDALAKCEGDVVTLNGPIGSYTYQWLNGGTPLADITKDIAVQVDGDYSVEVTDTLGCSIRSDTFNVRFYPYPADTLTPSGGTFTLCSGNSLALEADHSQAGMTWQWHKDGLPLVDELSYNYEAIESGIYQAVIRNAIGCETTTRGDTVIVQASPLVDLNDESLPAQICEGDALRLVTPQVIGQAYQWVKDGVALAGATDNLLDVSISGEYRVRVNNSVCEKWSDPFNLVVRGLPTADIVNNADAAICEGDDFQLHAAEAANYAYEWLDHNQPVPGETASALAIVKSGNYSLRVTNEFDCVQTSAVTTVVVNLKPPASVTAAGPATFCEGGEVELNGNAGPSLTYQWLKDGDVLTGITQQSLSVTEGGAYAVRVTNGNLCSRISEAVDVQVVTIPVASVVSESGQYSVCERDSLRLLAGGASSWDFQWFLNGVAIGNSSAEYFATQAGNYQLVASEGACRDTSSVLTLQTRANPLPVVKRDNEFLSVASFGTIQWYRDKEPLVGATQQSIRPESDGLYSVNVVNTAGCSAWSEAVPVCLPIPGIVKENDLLTVSFEASEYHWQYGGLPITGASLRSLTAQQSGRYSVVVTSDDGCIMETEEVTVCIPYPYIVRDGLSGVLYAYPKPALAYQWYLEGSLIPDGNTQVHVPDSPGRYSVSVTDLEGCVSASQPWVIAPVTGTEPTLSPALRFYPNPAKNTLSVEAGNGGKAISLLMIDASGREVYRCNVTEPLQQIDISALNPGIYTILVFDGTRTARSKLVKK